MIDRLRFETISASLKARNSGLRSDAVNFSLTQSGTARSTSAETAWSRLGIGATVLALGAAVVFIVGFAHSHALHEAAHDARHAFSFPCH